VIKTTSTPPLRRTEDGAGFKRGRWLIAKLRGPEHRRAVRLETSRRDTPTVLAWAGAIIILLSFTDYSALKHASSGYPWADILLGVVFVILAMIMHLVRIPRQLPPFILGLSLLSLGLLLTFEAWVDGDPTGLIYVLVIVTAFGPMVLNWGPYALAVIPITTMFSLVAYSTAGPKAVDWMTAIIASALVGASLLDVRRRSLDALADAREEAHLMAVTDQMTGIMNRHGIEMQAEKTRNRALQGKVNMYVAFIDIDGLKAANDKHGHMFGDQVIKSVSRAAQESIRGKDTVARWGGDELILIGAGDGPDRETLQNRLQANIQDSGIDLSKWPGRVSIGVAYGNPENETFTELVDKADKDMYKNRGR
jgi:diguanylate cyclase (GGDEF)-like protein